MTREGHNSAQWNCTACRRSVVVRGGVAGHPNWNRHKKYIKKKKIQAYAILKINPPPASSIIAAGEYVDVTRLPSEYSLVFGS